MEWSIFNCSLVTDTIRLTKMVEQHKCIRDRKCQKFILGSKTGNVRNGEGIRNWKYPKQSVSELKVSVKKTHPKRAFLSRCFVLFRPFLLSGSLNCKPVVSETFQFFYYTGTFSFWIKQKQFLKNFSQKWVFLTIRFWHFPFSQTQTSWHS